MFTWLTQKLGRALHTRRTTHLPKDHWYFAKAWQHAEREAHDDLLAGRFEDFKTIDELIAVLQPVQPFQTLSLAQKIAEALRRFSRRKYK